MRGYSLTCLNLNYNEIFAESLFTSTALGLYFGRRLWAYSLGLCFELVFSHMLWAFALGVCFGGVFWVCVLGVCFRSMFWAYVLGVCFRRKLWVYAVSVGLQSAWLCADDNAYKALGLCLWAYGFCQRNQKQMTKSTISICAEAYHDMRVFLTSTLRSYYIRQTVRSLTQS